MIQQILQTKLKKLAILIKINVEIIWLMVKNVFLKFQNVQVNTFMIPILPNPIKDVIHYAVKRILMQILNALRIVLILKLTSQKNINHFVEDALLLILLNSLNPKLK